MRSTLPLALSSAGRPFDCGLSDRTPLQPAGSSLLRRLRVQLPGRPGQSRLRRFWGAGLSGRHNLVRRDGLGGRGNGGRGKAGPAFGFRPGVDGGRHERRPLLRLLKS